MKIFWPTKRHRGTVLLLTLMMLILLTFEVATISLVAQRGLGEEGWLTSQNISARRGSEIALNRLEESLYTYLLTGTAANATTAFAFGGTDDIDNVTLTVTNPSSGASENTDIQMWAWVKERRGFWYHLMGRAKTGTVDLIAHRWVWLNPCNMNSAGSLSTIITGVDAPGHRNLVVSENGRIFFGTESQNAYYTWDKESGLSTIIPGSWGINDPGESSYGAAPDGRVFFAANTNSRFWTWHKDTGLTTILPANETTPGLTSTVVGDDGRVYFGEDAADGSFWTWHTSTGLSTIIRSESTVNAEYPGTWYEGMIAIHKASSRVFFSDADVTPDGNERAWSWHPSTGLSTIIDNAFGPLYGIPRESAPDGRIIVALHGNCVTCPLYTWKAGVGLSVLMANDMAEAMSHQTSDLISSNGRFHFGTNSNPSDGFFTWHPATGVSTIITGLGAPGQYASGGSSDGRVFFTDSVGGSQMYTYYLDTGLSTLVSGVAGQAKEISRESENVFASRWVTPSGRAFWGVSGNPSFLYSWHLTTGLSTLLSGTVNIGTEASIAVTDTERVYWGQPDATAASARIWTWHQDSGLSTITSAATLAGKRSTAVGINGEMFMGSSTLSSEALRYWDPPGACGSQGY